MKTKKNKRKNHSSSPSAARNVVSYIFSFILMIMLTLLGLMVVIRVAATPNFVSRSFDTTCAAYVKAYIEDTAVDYTLPTSIDISVAEDLFSEEMIYKDSVSAVRSAFAGTEFSPDTEDLRKELTRRVDNILASSGEQMTGQASEITEAYVDEIVEIYKSAFDIPGLSAVTEAVKKYGLYCWLAIASVAVISVILIIVCIKLHRWAHRGLRFVAYATGGAFLVTLAAPLVIYLGKFYEKIQITPQYVYYYLTNFLQRMLEFCIIVACFWLLITLIIIPIISLKRKKAVNHRG